VLGCRVVVLFCHWEILAIKQKVVGAARVRQTIIADSKSTGLVSIRAQAIIKRWNVILLI
jgi:hypothetical protein